MPDVHNPIAAVIFDMDGILIDTEPVWRRIEVEVFNRVGAPITYEATAETMGMRMVEVARLRHSQYPWTEPSVEAVADEVVSGVIDHVRTRGVPIPGAVEAMKTAADCGLPVAIASSSSHDLIDAVVETLGIRDLVASLSSADDVDASKPDPAVYLRAADSLGIVPGRCLAIEDSANGILSAVDAGMWCCAIPDSHWRDDERIERAHWRLDAVETLPVFLRERLTSALPSLP